MLHSSGTVPLFHRQLTPSKLFLSPKYKYAHKSYSTTVVSPTSSSHSSTKARHPLRILSLILLGAGVGGYYYITHDELLYRPFNFWQNVFPIYVDYRVSQFLEKWFKVPIDWEAKHESSSKEVLNLFLQLKGLYVKIGQVAATRNDIFPEAYRKQFWTLFDRVPGMSKEEVEYALEHALPNGLKAEDVFSEFDYEALGAASIGEVHKAVLKSTGQTVAVKIKYPSERGIALFRSDMETMKLFCRLAQPEQLPILGELERQFLSEFNFEQESWALETVSKNIMPHYRNVVIPRPVQRLCSRDMVVMEYLDGQKLVDAVTEEYKQVAKTLGLTLDELSKLNADADSNAQKLPLWKIVGASVLNQVVTRTRWMGVTLWNYTIGWFAPLPYPRPPINHAALLSTLVNVHGRQIFLDGVFNGDPHPGNILLLRDGRIGLIDYGQIKVLPIEDRIELAKMLLYLQKGQQDKVVEIVRRMGFETEKNSELVLFKTVQVAFDSDDPKYFELPDPNVKPRNIQEYMEELNKLDPTKKIPEQYVMSVRLAVLLRGIARLLNHPTPLHLAEEWAPFARELLNKEGIVVEDL